MSRPARIARNVAIGLLGLILVLVLTVLVVVQTAWFRNYVRQTIISDVEEGTGGRAEIGSFDFDVKNLRATVTDFVIHGTEPANAAPFVSIARVEVDLRLFTSLKHLYEITFLGVDHPAVNVTLQADGRSNIPTPRKKSASNESPLETVVNLAIDRFVLSNGALNLFSVRRPLTADGRNVRALLQYSMAKDAYDGTFAIEPLYVLNGRNTPVNFTVTLPVTLTKDRIDLHHATVTTPLSQISADASIANMNNPKITARVQGKIAGADLVNAADLPLSPNGRTPLPDLTIDANATGDSQTIQVAALRLGFGQSNVEASGTLKDPRGAGSLQAHAELSLRQLGQLAKLSSSPSGTVTLNAVAKLDSANRYDARGNIEGMNLAFSQGKSRFSDIGFLTSFEVVPGTVSLNGLRLNAFGGEFAGNASLADFERYQIAGMIRGFNIQTLLHMVGEKLPYEGGISGSLDARGDTKAVGAKGMAADAHLIVTPGRRGIPVSGRLNIAVNGDADNVLVEDSYLALPHTRLNVNGSVSRRLNISLASKDLHDLMLPVDLVNNATANFDGAVVGGVSRPRVTGHLAVGRFAVEGRQFDSLAADVAASGSRAAVSNAALVRGAMRATANASIGLRDWSPTPRSPVDVTAGIGDADLADVMALAGEDQAGYSGALSASARVTGTFGNPVGMATLQVDKGKVDGEPFNRIQVQANLTDRLAAIPVAYIDTGAGRVDLNAEFQHPRDSFSTGQLHAHVNAKLGSLGPLALVEKLVGKSSGSLTFDVDAAATLQKAQPEFLLNSVNADVSAKAVTFHGVHYGDLTATARTSGRTVTYDLTSDFAGSQIQASGNTQLTRDYPTDANLSIAALPIQRVLAMADETAIPARGVLAGSVHFDGTIAAPQGNVQLNLSNGSIYGEKIDRARLQMTYLSRSIDVPQLEVVSGSSRIDATAHFDHPVDNFRAGQARFTLAGDRLNLAQIAAAQRFRAGIGGTLNINANGAVTLQTASPAILITAVNANISANGIAAEGKQLGNLKLTANTQGRRVAFALDSNLAGAAIDGSGNATLTPQYPVDARLSIRNATWSRIADLIGRQTSGKPLFEAATDGEVAINGPLLDSSRLNGSIQLTKLNVTTIPRTRAERPIAIANQGPIQMALNQGVVRIQNAHIAGPKTDIQASGSASVKGTNLNLNLRANVDVGVAKDFDNDIYSGGNIALTARVRGDVSQPLVNGQLALQNVAFSTTSLPIGISNANGAIDFLGNSARIRTLTADSNGGKLTVTGSGSITDIPRFALQAQASNVRVNVQQGVSVTADANVRLAGSTEGSRITGTATVDRVSYAAQSDFGSILTRSAPPVQAPETPSPFLSNMKLEVRVRSLPGMTVQSTLSENLQTDINLRILGSANQPGVEGRIDVSSGKLLFFGTTYTVNTGSISFFNPLRIDPVLDLSLEAQAQGVTVTVHVAGPIDNMKFSYTSNPPLQFQEIISLLAAGTTPTSDPTLLANQPPQPQQGFQQMGESAIVGQAVANPVANQLQRVFGITQLKIDPSFTTGSQVPTARLALEQRITNNLTFTYVQAVDQPNSTIIRMEWAFSPMWSAVATRDQYGIFSLNFFYKRQFH